MSGKGSTTGASARLAALGALLLTAQGAARAGESIEGERVQGNFIVGFVVARWDPRALPVAWRLNNQGVVNNFNNGNTTPLDATTAASIIDQAFGQWNDIPESAAQAVFDRDCRLTGLRPGISCSGGLTSTALAGLDGENIMTWADSSASGGIAITLETTLQADLTVSAATRDINGDGQPDLSPAIYPDGTVLATGTIIDADIVLNAASFDWVTQPVATGTMVDVYSVVLHEEGHWFGFAHSPDVSPISTMFPLIDVLSVERQLDQRVLKVDDKASARRFYPVEPAFSSGFGSINGRLVDSAGAPVSGQPVIAIDATTLQAAAVAFSAHQITEGSAGPGSFLLEGLPPGDYLLEVDAFDSTHPHLDPGRYNDTTFFSTYDGHRPAFVAPAGRETTGDDLVSPRRVHVDARATAGVASVGDVVVNSGAPALAPLAGATPLHLKDDVAALLSFPGFTFPFYGVAYRQMFVYDNGYVTFTNAANPAPDPIIVVPGTRFANESLGTFLSQSPRAGALFRIHDPSTDDGGHSFGPLDVYFASQSDRVSLTWVAMPEEVLNPQNLRGAPARADTFTLTLFASGTIEMAYGSLSTPYGIVGLTPGGSGVVFHAVDLSQASFAQAGPLEAIGEVMSMARPDFAAGLYRFVNGMDLGGGRVRFIPQPGFAYAASRPDLAPPEISGPGSSAPLTATGVSPTVLAWEAAAPLFNLYRGLLSVLRSTGVYTPDSGACLASGLTQPQFTDAGAPAPGEGFYYLVTGELAGGIEGSLGADSAGRERLNTHPCP